MVDSANSYSDRVSRRSWLGPTGLHFSKNGQGGVDWYSLYHSICLARNPAGSVLFGCVMGWSFRLFGICALSISAFRSRSHLFFRRGSIRLVAAVCFATIGLTVLLIRYPNVSRYKPPPDACRGRFYSVERSLHLHLTCSTSSLLCRLSSCCNSVYLSGFGVGSVNCLINIIVLLPPSSSCVSSVVTWFYMWADAYL